MINIKTQKSKYNYLILGYSAQGLSYLAVILIPSLFFSQSQIGALGICLSLQYILSQFFGMGLHFSALYYKSLDVNSSEKLFCSVTSNIIVTLVSSSLGLLIFLLSPYLLNYYKYFDLEKFKTLLIISSVVFAINKVFLSEINAVKHYSLIGKLYLIKSFLFLTIIFSLISRNISFDQYVCLQLLLPEFFIYLICLFFVIKNYTVNKEIFFKKYFKRDLLFGLKSFWGTIFYEASTKVDLLLLGVFVSPAKVGIFTIISMISDLFLNICTVLRTIVNPEITENFLKKKESFNHFIQMKSIKNYIILIPILAVFVILYFISVTFIHQFATYSDGFVPLLILCLFLAATSGYIPLMLTFGQIGKPNFQSLNFLILFVFNVMFNWLLIPKYELIGAAFATGLSYVFYILFFRKALSFVTK
ncbi:polysaccharide biosynthesis C-terminal domain-containing protein [Flavobacterium sp.]|jgi:O-antigen/teichoic acid export membrane protein|uniref:polysaccharide biosynthesis C-terminal domain-containing protein n=1 Tax=Flavobacterium sp. TaxID=239 RepID=UPI0037BF080D